MVHHKGTNNLQIHHPIFHKLLGTDNKSVEFEVMDLIAPNKHL